ncbi:Trehalose/maltose import ATP-binding protein MalK [uncultured archaeon]|nr:Trehalose/maltose import ATP-binding protein MalK [uncultured archaeon]
MGPSGAVKSTLFKLLLKLHENYEGEILVDDVPLKEIDRASYIRGVAVVMQDTEVFNLSLKENIEIVREDKGDIDKALSVANVDEMLPRLPDGINTIIGEKGVKLSGGEKQRLGIARAIYRDPQILFLDEATSNLDARTEVTIRQALKHMFQNFTTIVIAHRLSTIKEMDRVIVLNNGEIVEVGHFNDLVKKKGLFFELWQKQKL